MKNLLLFSTLLLSTIGAFAQLTVRPTSGGADSFMYVNDEVVYVTNEINLTRNNPGNQEASIYLRNNGQLIQGGTTSNNSGNGQLSVQQNTPVTNPWAYYYWCSPVTNPAVAPGNRSFGVMHLYEALGVTAAQQVATVPTRDGFNSPRLTISTRWLYTHLNPGTEAEGNYQRMNGNNAAPAGFGFIMKGVNNGPIGNGGVPSNHDQLYEFRGRPNNGDFIIPVDDQLMTLSGNPYPSALDLNQLFYESGNEALSALWYYDEDRNVPTHYYSNKPYGYGVWVPGLPDAGPDFHDNNPPGIYSAQPFYIWNSGGTYGGSTGSTRNTNDKRYAPIGQGIMFVGNANGTVTIKNSHRIFYKEGPGSIFYRPGSEAPGEIATDSPDETHYSTISETSRPDYRIPAMRLWTTFDEAVTREMVIAFYDQATDGYDRGLDGLSAQDLKTDAYFPIGEDNNRKPYVINGIKYDPNKQVPIAFKIKNQSKLDIKVVEEVKKPYTHAYLFDSLENTYQQITGGLSATLNLPTGIYDNRFFIIFRNQNLSRDIPEDELNAKQIVMENIAFFQNNPQQQLEIRNPEGYVIKSAAVYDMSGKLVIHEKNLGDQTKYSFYTGNLSDGVYLVKLMTADDVAIDYKAIVHNK